MKSDSTKIKIEQKMSSTAGQVRKMFKICSFFFIINCMDIDSSKDNFS